MEDINNTDRIIEVMLNGLKKNNNIIDLLKKIDLSNISNPYNTEEKIINPISIGKINFSACGVDSGFATKQLNFANITIVKEVGVFFKYLDDQLVDHKYYPKIYNQAKPYLSSSSLELEEILWSSGILRLNKELDLSKKIMDLENVNLSLMDGSIIPQYINKPTKECKEREEYNKLIQKFIDLYTLSKQKKIFLVGCIEDCRANRFFKILKEEIDQTKEFLENSSGELFDSFTVFSLFPLNYRTGVFKYSKEPESHPVLCDFPKEFSDNLYVTYLKLSDVDYPLRIEFIYFKEFGYSLKEYTDKIVEMVSALSTFNKNYIYPTVLVESDIRSRLTIIEIDQIMSKILEKTKNFGFRNQRRESRLF